MESDQKIVFIGPGAMAESMIAGLIRNQVATPDKLLAAGPRQVRVDELSSKYGILPFTDNAEAARKGDVVVLSVKPQRLNNVMAGLSGNIQPGALVLSIIAGASIEQLSRGLQHTAIVRSMPNTPAQIGEGITVWTASATVTETQRELAASAFYRPWARIYSSKKSITWIWQPLSPEPVQPMSSSSWRRWSMPACIWAFHGVSPSSWWRRRCGARLIITPNGMIRSTWRACGMKLPHRRHLRRGLILPGKSRLSHGHLSGDLGSL